MSCCIKCGCQLIPDDIGLTKKLINRGATEFMCKKCLAEKFSCTTELLDKKIEQFRKQGCSLFV